MNTNKIVPLVKRRIQPKFLGDSNTSNNGSSSSSNTIIFKQGDSGLIESGNNNNNSNNENQENIVAQSTCTPLPTISTPSKTTTTTTTNNSVDIMTTIAPNTTMKQSSSGDNELTLLDLCKATPCALPISLQLSTPMNDNQYDKNEIDDLVGSLVIPFSLDLCTSELPSNPVLPLERQSTTVSLNKLLQKLELDQQSTTTTTTTTTPTTLPILENILIESTTSSQFIDDNDLQDRENIVNQIDDGIEGQQKEDGKEQGKVNRKTEEEDDEDEDEEDEVIPDNVNPLEIQRDLSDGEDDPDPVDFHPDDLNDQTKYKDLHEKIRQRNNRQRYAREQKLNEMFDRITNGEPAPYITPTKFEKRRKKRGPDGNEQQEKQQPFADVQDSELRDQLIQLSHLHNGGKELNSIEEEEDDPLENPLLQIGNNTKISQLNNNNQNNNNNNNNNLRNLPPTTPTRKTIKRKDPPPPSPVSNRNPQLQENNNIININQGSKNDKPNNSIQAAKWKKLFPTNSPIYKKMKSNMSGVGILNSSLLVANSSQSSIVMVLLATIRLSLFSKPIFEGIPKNTDGSKFTDLFNSKKLCETLMTTWKVDPAIKSYQSITTDQYLYGKAHTKKSISETFLCNRIITTLVPGTPTKLLRVLAEIPPNYTTLNKETIELMTVELKGMNILSEQELEMIQNVLTTLIPILATPSLNFNNPLNQRFSSPEIQSFITSRKEFSKEYKSILNNNNDKEKEKDKVKNQQSKSNSLSQPTQPNTISTSTSPSTTVPVAPINQQSQSAPNQSQVQEEGQIQDQIQLQIQTNQVPPPQSQPQQQQQQPQAPSQAQITIVQPQVQINQPSQQQQQQTMIQKGVQQTTQSFIQNLQQNLSTMDSEKQIQHLINLLSTQHSQLQHSQLENQKLTTNNQILFQHLQQYVSNFNQIKSKWDEHSSFMNHAMRFTLSKKN